VVVEKRLASNELIVAFDRLDTEGLYARRCRIGSLSFTNRRIPDRAQIAAKPRYRAKASAVLFEALGEKSAILEFEEPQRALTPGQICALYEGEQLIGGGVFEFLDGSTLGCDWAFEQDLTSPIPIWSGVKNF
jgi:tRNA-specific 2-thiouridylase